MTLRRFLRAVRRWRSLVVAGTLIGVVVGWVSAPGTASAPVTFQATHTLIPKPGASVQILQAAAVATLGAVPRRVASRLGTEPQLVQSAVSTDTPANTGLLLIMARSTDRAQAQALADLTAEELIVELGGPNAPLSTLEPAVARPLETGDIVGPRSRSSRAPLLGAFGLMLGVGAALAVEQFDRRIRSKRDVEDALGAPVVAEVPPLPRSARGRLLSPAEHRSFFEAYRGLRSSIDRWMGPPTGGADQKVIVVTSVVGGEGATTTVAHLARVVGEIGRSAVVVSADFRRPRLHLYFDKALEPGLADVLRGAPDTPRLADLNLATQVRGVRFVASGVTPRNSSSLVARIGDRLPEARGLGDLVLVDAPPLMTTSDGVDVALHADGVLMVVRVGYTPRSAVARSAELLQRLGVPIMGAVLVGSDKPGERT